MKLSEIATEPKLNKVVLDKQEIVEAAYFMTCPQALNQISILQVS